MRRPDPNERVRASSFRARSVWSSTMASWDGPSQTAPARPFRLVRPIRCPRSRPFRPARSLTGAPEAAPTASEHPSVGSIRTSNGLTPESRRASTTIGLRTACHPLAALRVVAQANEHGRADHARSDAVAARNILGALLDDVVRSVALRAALHVTSGHGSSTFNCRKRSPGARPSRAAPRTRPATHSILGARCPITPVCTASPRSIARRCQQRPRVR